MKKEIVPPVLCVPLRVPVCTLTDATLCGYSLGFSNCIKGLRLARSTVRLSCRRCTTFIIGAVTISYRLASIMPILIVL